MDPNPTELEYQALHIALAGAAAWLAPLRQQIPHLRVLTRKHTGVGFFTDFTCEGCVAGTDRPPTGSPDSVPVAWAAHPEVENGGFGAITFNVFIRDGIISCLEGASTAAWPETEDLITFTE